MAKILVVDDDESICQLVSDFFCDLKGHTVFTAQNAEDALEAVREHSPEVALLDIMMPGGGYIASPSHDYLLPETPIE